MRIPNIVKSQKGLTIIEVLIASVVFMIGFSIMVFFLGEIIGKYSTKEHTIAYNLALKNMETTLASGDFTTLEKSEKVSEINWKIERLVENESNLYKIRINIIREKTGKLLISLYNEKYVK